MPAMYIWSKYYDYPCFTDETVLQVPQPFESRERAEMIFSISVVLDTEAP